MVGADKDWVKADGSQSVQYRLLPPGKYLFRVKVENLDGVANEEVTTLTILVKPHFWQTGWFVSLLLMMVAMVAYGMHRLRLKRILAVERIRGRVSRDLHDDMGSTLSTINILSSMAKAKLSTDIAKTAVYLGKISDNSQRMMEAMDDIVWAIKPDNDTMQKLIARMREFATSVLEAKDILIDFEADEALNDLKPDMEYRRDLFLLFKEAVNNAAKYSKSTKVTIRIAIENRRLVMEGVSIEGEDNGYAEFVETVDTIIMGRKTYDWVNKHAAFPHSDKQVFIITRTPRPSEGNITFYTGNLQTLVEQLKKQPGKHIFCDGGAEIVHALLLENLIDEFIISIIPVLLGGGTRLFKEGHYTQQLRLLRSQSFTSGLVQVQYTKHQS